MGEQAQVLEFGDPAWILTIYTTLKGNTAEGYVTGLLASARRPARIVELGCECGQCLPTLAVEIMYPGTDAGRAGAVYRVELAGGVALDADDAWVGHADGDVWSTVSTISGTEVVTYFRLERSVWCAERHERLLARLDASLDRLHALSDGDLERVISLLERVVK